MEKFQEKVINFTKRNSIILLLVAVVLYFAKIDDETQQLAIKVLGAETLALIMSALAIYCLTEIDFVKEKSPVIGWIILAVHFLVGLSIVGIYIVEHSN